jgi:hypothetical protein
VVPVQYGMECEVKIVLLAAKKTKYCSWNKKELRICHSLVGKNCDFVVVGNVSFEWTILVGRRHEEASMLSMYV